MKKHEKPEIYLVADARLMPSSRLIVLEFDGPIVESEIVAHDVARHKAKAV